MNGTAVEANVFFLKKQQLFVFNYDTQDKKEEEQEP